ncbi:cupin domain-containing protein [Paraburkholderia hospita]|jgi:mannose-6-phosphate isomerase-like protein (cupin superfamily)|uniref:cupin domain-containing protein n=1 Tax=Paraburkholderia hospita TaxID=169430 RepID=UPI000B344B5F|nr:cupin domain-containing protein [Paraburkholderia hospita]OUL67847.1 cupin [Paraburkholderia hospita]
MTQRFANPSASDHLARGLSTFPPALPVLVESEEEVDLAGVRLFMHVFGHRVAHAPLRSSRFTIQPGCGTCEDHHAVSEIWFVSRGQLDVCCDGTWHHIAAGQAVFFEAWQSHFARNVGDVDAEIFSVWWK